MTVLIQKFQIFVKSAKKCNKFNFFLDREILKGKPVYFLKKTPRKADFSAPDLTFSGFYRNLQIKTAQKFKFYA